MAIISVNNSLKYLKIKFAIFWLSTEKTNKKKYEHNKSLNLKPT